MQRSVRAKVVSLLLVVAFPCSMLYSDTAGALLRTPGGTSVNGKPAPNFVALYAGDKISTASDGEATITALGSILTVAASSNLTYDGRAVEMGCGTLSGNGSSHGLPVKVRNLTVSSASDSSKFNILHSAGKLQIGALEGSIFVDDGQQRTMVTAGQALNFDSPDECTEKPAHAKKAPAAGFHLSAGKLGVLTAAAAGGIAAGVVLSNRGKKCTSPDGSGNCQ